MLRSFGYLARRPNAEKLIFRREQFNPETASAQNHPNILFVLTDDVGWGDVRAYNLNSLVSLPTIDMLTAEGMRFTDAHTSAAKCAPCRAQ